MIWTAFILGLLGSLHCIGMCGPIALALPLNRKSKRTAVSGAVIYNVGRVTSYAVLGLILGKIGQAFLVIGWQRWVSIIAGVLLLGYALFTYVIKRPLKFVPKLYIGWVSKIKSALLNQFKKTSATSLFTIGVLNGLLPCGFVYFALVGAISTNQALYGSAYMMLFGLGTVPVLFALNVFGANMTQLMRIRINRFVPYVIVIFGLLFILRGLALDIPFLSPAISSMEPVSINCH